MPDAVFVLVRTSSCPNEHLLRKKVFSYYLGRNRDCKLDSESNLGSPRPDLVCLLKGADVILLNKIVC